MTYNKIISGISFSWLRFVVGFIITLIQTPLLFRYLPKEEVSLWYLFFSAAAFLQMSDFGLPSAVSRAIAYIKNNQIKSEQPEAKFYTQFSVKDIYRSAFTSFIFISAIVVIIGTILIIQLKPGFGLTHITSSDISYVFAIFLAGVFFNMTANIPNACLIGMGDVGFDSLIRVIVLSLGLIAILILLPLFPSILTLSYIYLGQGIFSMFIVHWILRIKHRRLFRIKGNFNTRLIKHLYKESIPLFINQIGSWFTNQSGIWIATIILGVSLIADYSVLVQLIFYGLSISMSIPAAISPFAASAFSSGGIRAVHKYFFLTLKLSSFIVAFWIIILAVYGDSVLSLWIGPGHFLGYGVLIPLLINLFFELQHAISGGFVWNTGKWPFVPVTLAAGLLNIIFAYIGCNYWGFTGLAIGTMLAKLLTLNWYVVFYSLKRLNISFVTYFKEYFIRVILISIAILPLTFLIKFQLMRFQINFAFRKLPGNVISSFLIGTIITFLFCIFLYYKFALKRSEKYYLNNIFRKRHFTKWEINNVLTK